MSNEIEEASDNFGFDPDTYFSAHDINAMVYQALQHAKEDGLTEAELDAMTSEMVVLAFQATCLELWRQGAISVGWDREQHTVRWYGDPATPPFKPAPDTDDHGSHPLDPEGLLMGQLRRLGGDSVGEDG